MTSTAENFKTGATVEVTEVRRSLDLFCGHHGITELRALGCRQRFGGPFEASGYFDNFEQAAEQVDELDRELRPSGIYFVFNDVAPACLSRYCNRFELRPKHTTGDKEIIRRRWLFVDLDPPRPAGISATDAEKNSARDIREEIFEELRTQAEPIIADSSNGWHLYIPIDLPNDDEAKAKVQRLLQAFKLRWPLVDSQTFNAARITKLYGSVSRKGDSTPTRPHRVSELIYVPDYLAQGWTDD